MARNVERLLKRRGPHDALTAERMNMLLDGREPEAAAEVDIVRVLGEVDGVVSVQKIDDPRRRNTAGHRMFLLQTNLESVGKVSVLVTRTTKECHGVIQKLRDRHGDEYEEWKRKSGWIYVSQDKTPEDIVGLVNSQLGEITAYRQYQRKTK